MSTTITAFPITTTPISGLGAAVTPFVPASGDLFAVVQIANPAQAPGGSLVKFTWAQLMTSPVLTGAPTIASGTITANAPGLTITQTWNNGAVTFTALKVNATDTLSAATSLLADLQIASASKFSVDKTGKITHAGDLATAGNAAITGTLGVTGNTTVTQITASTKLATSTTGVTNGCAVADATTSATTSYSPKGLGIKAYFGADKANTLVTNSADGDAIIMATAGNILLSSGGTNIGLKVDTSNNLVAIAGNFQFFTAGKGLILKTGSNARAGTSILVAGTVTIANTSVTVNTRPQLTVSAQSAPGFLKYNLTAGVGFQIVSSNGADASTVDWVLNEVS